MSATMTAVDFVSRLMSDKAFLLEVCKNIPDELVRDEPAQPDGGNATQDLNLLMGRYFSAAAQAMGHDFGEDEVSAECGRQLDALGKFAKVRFVVRFLKTLVKAGKGKKG